jgi:hypothetical protein
MGNLAGVVGAAMKSEVFGELASEAFRERFETLYEAIAGLEGDDLLTLTAQILMYDAAVFGRIANEEADQGDLSRAFSLTMAHLSAIMAAQRGLV